MAKKSLLNRIKKKQSETFIGRTEYIESFTKNLESEDPTIIFNIYGQGGVGKSFLSQKFIRIAEEKNCLCIYTDEGIKSILDWMESVSSQFKRKGAELKEFDRIYKTYKQETKKLESDPEKPKGTLATIIKTAGKGLIKEGKKWIPGGELAEELINEDAIVDIASEWADFAFKKIGNKDEVELVLEPIKVLSPIFWTDIYEHSSKSEHLIFILDTFEETDSYLEKWILDILEGKYGDDIPENTQLVIAGRERLKANSWSAYASAIQTISLEPFSEKEALNFLESNNIVQENLQQDIIRLSEKLPVLMSWLVETAKMGDTDLEDVSDTAVERFLKWIKDPSKRNIALCLSLPRSFNLDTLSCFIEESEKANEFFTWIVSQPFVKKQGESWIYHQVVRNQMLRYQRLRSIKEWEENHKLLCDHFYSQQEKLDISENAKLSNSRWMDLEIKRSYHSLFTDVNKEIPILTRLTVKIWYETNLGASLILVDNLIQAGLENENIDSEKLGRKLKAAIQAFTQNENGENSPFANLIDSILDKNWINEKNHKSFLYSLKGRIFSRTKNYTEAINCLLKAIKIKPDEHRLLYNMGNVYALMENYEEAISSFKKALKIKPDFHQAFCNLGISYGFLQNDEEAINSFKKAIEIKPDEHLACYNMGLAYSRQKDYQEAINCYKKAIVIKPDYHQVLYSMGMTYSDLKDYQGAINCYKKAIEIKPDYYQAFNKMGETYGLLGNYSEAVNCCKKAIEIKPIELSSFFLMGVCYSAIQNYSESINYYKKAIEIKPDLHIAFYAMGNAYKYLKKYQEAIKCYKKAIEVKPDYQQAFHKMGIVYSDLKKYQEAINCYKKAIEIKPDNYQTFQNLGNIYFGLKHNVEAISCYKKATEIQPDYHQVLHRMGIAYSYLKDYREAISCYKKATEIQPDNFTAYGNIGSSYKNLKKYEEAIKYYKKALEIKPDYFKAYGHMGIIYENLERHKEAIYYYKRFLEIKPDDWFVHMHLGVCYFIIGRLGEAEKNLFKSIELGSISLGNMNLGHVYLVQRKDQKAIEKYIISINNFKNESEFWFVWENDFKYLKQYKITRKKYEELAEEVKMATKC